jgi:hypothetical protein
MSLRLASTLMTLGCLVATTACRSRPSEPSQPQRVDVASTQQADATTTIEIVDGSRASIRHAGSEVVSFEYRFWGGDWAWAEQSVRQGSNERGRTTFEIDVPDLSLHISGKSEPTGEGELTFAYQIEAQRSLSDIVGGGVEFSIRTDEDAAPILLEGGRGWKWSMPDGTSMEVTFDPPVETLYFEPGRKDRIRAMLVGTHVEPGRREVAMRLRLPAGGAVIASLTERYGHPDTGSWHAGTLAWDRWPIDISHLNADDRPAGKHGAVRAQGDALVFADGTPARFWGTNVAAYALFTGDRDAVRLQARRLAAFGFNLVRIHHHDSHWVTPNIFVPGKSTRTLDDNALDRIDWWVKCLQDEGIYVWLDLHVERPFSEADGIRGSDEVLRSSDIGKGFNYVNPDIEARMKEFARRYLGRANRYTGRRYVDDPGVLAVLVTNENDITHHFGHLFSESAGNPKHRKLYEQLGRAFVAGVGPDVPHPGDRFEPWKPGPDKVVLNEIEARFSKRAIQDLRALGYDGLVATTNFWGDNRMWALPSLTVGDLIDVHSYGGPEQLSKNPHHEANFVAHIATAAAAGKPLAITEWNVPAPARDRFTAPLYLASIAALQGWDAPMLYVYLQAPVEPPTKPMQWTSFEDPAVMAMMPAAALLYRRGDVSPAQKTYRLQLDARAVYGADTTALSSAAIRTLYEQSRLEIGLPDLPSLDWDGVPAPAEGTEVFTDPDRSFLEDGSTSVTSDTGELRRDFGAGVHTIDTTRTQSASGWIGGRRIELGDVTIEIDTPKATVCVSSLDGRPIAASQRLLVTAVAQVVPSPGNQLPLLAQPVVGEVILRHSSSKLELAPLLGGGAATGDARRVRPRSENGRHAFTLPHDAPTHWFVIERRDRSPSGR